MVWVPWLIGGLVSLQLAAADLSAAPRLRQSDAEILALSRNRQLIAARLEVQEAMVAQVTARLWPNPELSYGLGNLVLGRGFDQDQGLRPTPLSQLQHGVQLSQQLDLFFKRAQRRKVADLGVLGARLRVEDAVRQVRHLVRAQFARVLREQDECGLATGMRRRYDRTVALCAKRLAAGEISAAEQDKIILEKLKYVNQEIDARTELQVARQELAALLAFESHAELALELDDEAAVPQSRDVDSLFALACAARPDLQAAQLARTQAQAAHIAAQREALPDPTLSVGYTRSYFQASGDNPHALGLSLSLPLPLFARNQDGRRAASVQLLQAEAALDALRLQIATEVRNAVGQVARARAMLDVYEGEMLGRAEGAMTVAERSYRAGATNLLELLEAQRTYLETRASFLSTQYAWRKALLDVDFAVGHVDQGVSS